jgi:Xaa-Pro aminopeptidase
MLLNRDRANEMMDRDGLDALIAVSPNNVYYLSDFETDFLYDVPWVACAILPRSPDIAPCLVVTEIEIAVLIQRPSWMPDVRTYYFDIYGDVLPVHTFNEDEPLTGEDAQIAAMVQELQSRRTVNVMGGVIPALREKGLTKGRLGFDDIRFAGLLGDTIAEAQIVDASNSFIEIRMVKSPDEIAVLREAATKNQIAIEAAIAAIDDGATWQDVATAYEISLVQQGARPFATFNGAGRKSAGAGRPYKDYTIRRGDMICFDCMMKYRRYMGDAQRTAILGQASEKLQRYWKAVKTGAEEAYGGMKAGLSTGQLRRVAVETIRKNGIPNFQLAFIHGVGLDHIELPYTAGGKLGVFPLEANMVVNMDIEVHEIGFGGVFFEETMLITESGAERLYTLPRDLIRL